MERFQVAENAKYLGETWGGYFTGVTEDYGWAKKQMETRFMKYLHEYKDMNPSVSMGRMCCKLSFDDGDFIEVVIHNLTQEEKGNERYKCEEDSCLGM